MSLRLEVLQVARLAPRLLGDSAELVRDFILERLNDDGGFQDRQGRSDLYYTVFGLSCLEALQAEIPRQRVAGYLCGFGDGEGLDLVHLTSLARAWAAVGGNGRRDALLRRLEELRGDDRSVTDGFLAYGAYQDLESEPGEDVAALLRARRAADGGWINQPPATAGSTPATAAAVTLLAHLRQPPPAAATAWLEARFSVHGGFTAAPDVAMPDLLSTAVVLHALAAAERPLARFVEPCLELVDSLWTNRGAFHGHWADDEVDCEYTYYGLLALGHLAVWSD